MYIVTFIDAVSINNAGLFFIPKRDYVFWILGMKQNVDDIFSLRYSDNSSTKIR